MEQEIEPECRFGPVESWLGPHWGRTWRGIKWMFTCAVLTYLSLNLIVGVPRMWQYHTFGLIAFGPGSDFVLVEVEQKQGDGKTVKITKDCGGHRLEDETLVQAAIAGLMGGIGSVIFCMRELITMWQNQKQFFGGTFAPLYLRPLFGILLSLIFFFMLKAGMLATSGGAPVAEVPGAADVAKAFAAGTGGLVGMCAEEAISRLKKVAEALFVPTEGSAKKGPGGN